MEISQQDLEYYREASARALRLESLSKSEWERSNDLQHLDEAIGHLEQALDFQADLHIPSTHCGPGLAEILRRLHNNLDTRYKSTGVLRDLERQVWALEQLHDVKNSSLVCLQLAMALVHRAARGTREACRSDVRRSACILREIRQSDTLSQEPHAQTALLGGLDTLAGEVLSMNVDDVDEFADLVCAVTGSTREEVWRGQAHKKLKEMLEVELSRMGLDRPMLRSMWATRDHYLGLAGQHDEESLAVACAAIITTTEKGLSECMQQNPESKDGSLLLGAVGAAYYRRWDKLGRDEEDYRRAEDYFRRSMSYPHSSIPHRHRHATDFFHMAVLKGDRATCYEISKTILDCYPELLAHSANSSDKQWILRQAGFGRGGFSAACAAFAAIDAGHGAFAALEMLEKGRGLVEGSLEARQTRDIFRDEQTLSTTEGKHAAPGLRYQNLLPKLEDLLRPPSLEAALEAAEDGPIVSVFGAHHHFIFSGALILQKGFDPYAMPLHVRKEDLDKYSELVSDPTKAQAEDIEEMLEWLWNYVAQPILRVLEFLDTPSDGEEANRVLPRVWWVMTGPYTRFPIHAAGKYGDMDVASNSVLDKVMSSYARSVKSLIKARQTRREDRLLLPPPPERLAVLVGMEETPGRPHNRPLGRLPHATREVESIANICRRHGLAARVLPRTKREVLSALSSCSMFHFAGHAGADMVDPSRGRLLLEDWETDELTVASLMDIDLGLREERPFLAYLSACGTGRTDLELADQTMHLISAFQSAGFRHVIGTLWAVKDSSSMHMAEKVYSGMLESSELDDLAVCRAVHEATLAMRDQWLEQRDELQSEQAQFRGSQTRGNDTSLGLRDSISLEDPPMFWVPYVHYGA